MVRDDLHGYLGKVPWCPPLVAVADGTVAHLLCWERHGANGRWRPWVSWVQAGDRPRHHVVTVRAGVVRQLEAPGGYELVPRRVLGNDGQLRPWSG